MEEDQPREIVVAVEVHLQLAPVQQGPVSLRVEGQVKLLRSVELVRLLRYGVPF
jgi:hypothetical protein